MCLILMKLVMNKNNILKKTPKVMLKKHTIVKNTNIIRYNIL